jgi:hypothetical protein
LFSNHIGGVMIRLCDDDDDDDDDARRLLDQHA